MRPIKVLEDVLKALGERGIICEGLVQYLERDLAVQGLLHRKVDGGHATSTDQAL